MADRESDEITRTGRAGFRCGPYLLVELIDVGGFSEVWSARHELVDRRAAIKILRPHQQSADARARFEREIRLNAKLTHDNVVSFYEAGFCTGPGGERILWLAMELLEGATLRARLNDGERFEQEDAVRIAYEMASGVAEAHELGVVHRDLKPENVFITRAEMVKVLDFGIAKFLGWGYLSTGRMRGVLGTPSYMSPEQVTGETPSFPSDVYQICLVLYEMLAGRHPFGYADGEKPTQAQMCELQVGANPRPLAELGVDQDVAGLVERGLRKDPLDRYATGRDLADALWTVLGALRKRNGKRRAPMDEVNPASSSGEPLGQQARRAYQPATTAPRDAPPPMPAQTVEVDPALVTEVPRVAEHREQTARIDPVAVLPVWSGDKVAGAPSTAPGKRWEKTGLVDPKVPAPTWRAALAEAGPGRDAITEEVARRSRPKAGAGGWPRWLFVWLGASTIASVGLAVHFFMPWRVSVQVGDARTPAPVEAPAPSAKPEPAPAPSEPAKAVATAATASAMPSAPAAASATMLAPTATASATVTVAPQAPAPKPPPPAPRLAVAAAPTATATPTATAAPTAPTVKRATGRLFGSEDE